MKNNVIKDLRFLKQFCKHFKIQGEFCSKYKYFEGDSDKDKDGKYLPSVFEFKKMKLKLKYFDGCFYPYLTIVNN